MNLATDLLLHPRWHWITGLILLGGDPECRWIVIAEEDHPIAAPCTTDQSARALIDGAWQELRLTSDETGLIIEVPDSTHELTSLRLDLASPATAGILYYMLTRSNRRCGPVDPTNGERVAALLYTTWARQASKLH
jgi:hypothetical protein